MKALQDPLWLKIATFRLDDPDARSSFSQRLARDNGWSLSYALRVVEEYRRFVYLAMTCGHAVTPSEQVDQAWHLHLIYSYSYWTEFCGGLLGRSFHHGPTKGGSAEVAKHDDWYRRTVESYEAAFGHPAPPDIWPNAEERFCPANRWQRVNHRDCWVIPKPRHLARAAQWALLAGSGLALTGCLASQFAEIPLLDLPGPAFLKAFIGIIIGCLVLAAIVRYLGSRADSVGAAPPSDPYLTALLNGGRRLAVGAAVTELHRRKLLEVTTRAKWIPLSGGDDRNLHPFEVRVLQVAAEESSIPKIVKRLDLDLATMEAKLESQNLLLLRSRFSSLRWRVLAITLIPVVLGVLKMWIGLSRHRPVSNLIGLEIFAAIGAVILTATVARRTSVGARALKALRHQMAHLKSEKTLTLSTGEATGELPLAMAVFGASVLEATPLAALQHRLGLVSSSSGGGDNSSGCGGGGGGGCGGCSSS